MKFEKSGRQIHVELQLSQFHLLVCT